LESHFFNGFQNLWEGDGLIHERETGQRAERNFQTTYNPTK